MRFTTIPSGFLRGIAAAVLSCLVAVQAPAQFKEDAIRLATPSLGVGARSLALGNAYTGVASDFSALYWNPAGLAQAQFGEFSFGLSYLKAGDRGSFMNTSETYSVNATNLNTLGLVFPTPVRRGSLVFAFGYNRESAFNSGLSFNGVNPATSIIQSYARDKDPYPSDLSGNIAYQLYLADIDTTSGRFRSPINGGLRQSGQVTEKGGLNDWSIGGALDIAKNLSLGVTLTYISGSYRYDRSYKEEDAARLYQVHPYDFQQLTIDDYIEGDISGVNAKFGLMYRVPERFRFGISIKTPTSFTVKETFGTSARAYFDNGDVEPVDQAFSSDGSDEYDAHTPWIFGAGMSITLRGLMLTGDVEYTDWTELEFAKANQQVLAENKAIMNDLEGTVNLRGGAEYDFQSIGLRLRGGFMLYPSPYKKDPSSFDRKYITGGIGFLLGESSMLDLGYARGWWNTYRINYDPAPDAAPRVDEKITTHTLLLTFTHRF